MGKNDKKEKKSLYQESIDELNAEWKQIKEAAQNCDPKIQTYVQNIENEKGLFSLYGEYERYMNQWKSDLVTNNSYKKSEEAKEKFKETNAAYQGLQSVIRSMKYMVGLTNDGSNLHNFYSHKYDPYRKMGLEKNLEKVPENPNQEKAPENPEKGIESIFPENAVIGVKYPAVDPENVFSEKQAELKDRLASIHLVMQCRPANVRKRIEAFEKSDFFKETKEKMEQEAKVQYQNQLKEERKYAFEQTVEVLEYLAGITRQLDQNVRKNVESAEKSDIIPKLPKEGTKEEQELREVVKPWEMGKQARLDVKFENMDHMLTNMQLASAKNQGEDATALAESKVPTEAAEKYLSLSLEATVNRLLDPLYQDFEQQNPPIDRADMITLNGKTVKNLMEEKFGKDKLDQMNAEDKKKEANLMIAAGLQTESRIEAFIPQGDGKVSNVPFLLGMSGSKLKELIKVEDNFFMQFIYKICDWLGLTNREMELESKNKLYHDTMSARNEICSMLDQNHLLDKSKPPKDFEKELQKKLGENKEKSEDDPVNDEDVEIRL